MATEENKDEGTSCCAKSKCCGKGLAALALLLIGGAVGYFGGRHCCAVKTDAAPSASAPAQTPAK